MSNKNLKKKWEDPAYREKMEKQLSDMRDKSAKTIKVRHPYCKKPFNYQCYELYERLNKCEVRESTKKSAKWY